ncbi:MAG TPA: endonuclease/exonuclease/phosphatase family protein [Sphingobacterium sp.]|nr:endonuclease/exonuclease/phosphatase family protein [Sphingobacterium sp.]
MRYRKQRGFTQKTLLIANIIVAASLLISYSASFIDPNIFWPIAFFGLAFLPLLLLNLLFIIYWVFISPKYILISLLAVLTGWSLLTKHYKLDIAKPTGNEFEIPKKGSNFRVMSFNAHLLKPINEQDSIDFLDELITIIKDIEPDIISFQEFYTKGDSQANALNSIKAKGEFSDYFFDVVSKNNSDAYGQIIFSKHPIIHSGTVAEHNYGINRISYADIVRATDTIRIYNVHLRSFALQNEDKEFFQRLAQSELNEKKPKNLSKKLKVAFNHRGQQARALKNHIEETDSISTVVMGDFNDTPMSYAVNLISNGMNNAFQKKGRGWGVTHFDLLPIFQIDYILSSIDLEVVNYQIIKKKLSDHYPLWADLKPAKKTN